jgi:DNA-binding transcriptional LysR family regulator
VELRHLRYFLAVAEELHFARAASRLHVAQPALSRQIRDLERELGVSLFERDRRHVALSAAGMALLPEVRRMFRILAGAIEAAGRADRGEEGRIRVGYVPSVAAHAELSEVVRGFREAYPGVHVRLSEMSPTAQVRRLLDDRLDVGFVRGPLREASLAVETVYEEPLCVAAPKGHRLTRTREVDLATLAAERFVLPARARGLGPHEQILAMCRAAGFAPSVAQEGSFLDVLSLVAAGAGVAIAPTSLCRRVGAAIVHRPLVGRPRTSIVVAWRRDTRSAALRAFVERTKAVFRGLR